MYLIVGACKWVDMYSIELVHIGSNLNIYLKTKNSIIKVLNDTVY